MLSKRKWIIESYSDGLSPSVYKNLAEGENIGVESGQYKPHTWVIKQRSEPTARDCYMCVVYSTYDLRC
jgi:hypothetical protein